MLMGLSAPGMGEIIIILIVVLLIFGPTKLPQLGEGIGKMLRGFKKEMKALDDEKRAEGEVPAQREEIDVTPGSPTSKPADKQA